MPPRAPVATGPRSLARNGRRLGARDLCLTSLTLAGLSEAEAAICADAVLFASRRGFDSHGMIEIMPATARNVAKAMVRRSRRRASTGWAR
jgi:LDH2 family malate/lactate/ureidoglycolate dehydrogenase